MKKRCKRIAEKIAGLIVAGLFYFFIVLWRMSKGRKYKNNQFPVHKAKETIKTVSKPSQNMGKIVPKVSMTNCFPPNKYKVVSKPPKWDPNSICPYIDRIGKCVGADRVHGAKLQFDTGETITIPFESIQLVEKKKEETQNLPVVAQEVELVKGHYYKLIRKPTEWDSACKYLNQTGKCLLVDDRGARLRFTDGNDISFQADVLEAAPSIDLSAVIPDAELTEENIEHDGLYIIIKAPEKFGEGKQLVGRVGKAKWPNYRGVCLKFPDKSSYVIPFDCLAKYVPPTPVNPVPVPKALSANNIVLGRKYKVKAVPGEWPDQDKRYYIGQFAMVIAATDIQKSARMIFDNKMEKMVPFNCLEDLPRPSEDELIELIKQYPKQLLKIIRQINSITRLKPVRDFIQIGLLPYVKEEATTVYGPHLPVQHSVALLNTASTVGESEDEMMNHVVSMFNAEEHQPTPAPVTEVAAED